MEAPLGVAAAPAVASCASPKASCSPLDGDVAGARAVLARAAELALATGHPSQSVGALTARAEAEFAGGDRRAAAAALSEAARSRATEPVLPCVAAALAPAGARSAGARWP